MNSGQQETGQQETGQHEEVLHYELKEPNYSITDNSNKNEIDNCIISSII